jgi:hypothetical protein
MFGSHKKAQFRYIPRYYDENLEDLRKRVAKIKAEMGETDTTTYKAGSNIKGSFHAPKKKELSALQRRNKVANIRLFVTILLLLYVAYYILTTDYFQDILTQFLSFAHGR